MSVFFSDPFELTKPAEEQDWSCDVSSIPQYFDHLLSGAPYPDNCVSPAIDIFKQIQVVYILETYDIHGLCCSHYTIVDWETIGSMNITGIDSLLMPLKTYRKRASGVSFLCYHENAVGCPQGFTPVHVPFSTAFECRTLVMLK